MVSARTVVARGDGARIIVPLVVILLMLVSVPASATASAAPPPAASVAVTRVLARLHPTDGLRPTSAMRRLRSLHIRTLAGTTRMSASRAERARVVPLAVSHRAANTSAANLALPQSVLDAGGGTQGLVGSGQGPFRVLHQHWTGYQSGVAAAFNFEPIMDLFYQGSVFGSSGAARAYMMESYNQLATGNSVPPKDCSSIIGDPCAIIGYVTTSDELAVYQVAQVNYCTIETGIQGDADLINANSDTVSKAAADTFLLGVQEAQAACTGASSNPQPTAVPPTPRPTVAPAPTARPTTAPLPTPLPTPTRSNGGTGTSATGLIFKANGAGSKTTRTLAVPGTWQLDWWYNCTATAKNGHFTITARDSGGTVSPQVSRYGREDHGQVQYHRGGRVSLAIKTPCHWHLKVYGQP